MKSKKYLISLFAFLLSVMFVFSACGATSKSNYSVSSSTAMAAPQASADMMEMENGITDSDTTSAPNNQSSDMLSERKIIKHSNLELETMDFDSSLEQIISAISQNEGYVESQNISGQSIRYKGDYYERSANISARIPAEKLELVSNAIGGICNVTSRWEEIDDITDRYYDTDAHLKSLTLQEERLLEILSKAEKLEDVISLERALSEVRYEIESLTAVLKRMDSQVSYSYLNLSLREVVEYQSVDAAPKTFGEKLSASFGRSAKNLSSFFQNALFFIIEDMPILLICLSIIGAIALLASKAFSLIRNKTKKQAGAQKTLPENKNDK